MFAFIGRLIVAAALRRSWAQKSGAWLGLAMALVLLGRFDAAARRRQRR
ncbi:MAG: hypothetical protein KGL23_08335 [Acidobacteriota bacterium]|nr:hypothetical protein [Acidobacteriota bacterium]MDE3030481.1 hypothetical protein [Acidobacteriota bacterium]MDE3092202.1 hypothetical protein [Acidobacteriota bacterium]MDE3139970.1 hypothetical protein [Acidobacteriota bacterium]MDE3147425.1 hypothetical protein [Acidobacteriota bacterium]